MDNEARIFASESLIQHSGPSLDTSELDIRDTDANDALHETQVAPPAAQRTIDSVPTELWAEIFAHYMPPYPQCPPLFGPSSPTILAQVCRRWRAVAHSLPMLWQAMELFRSKHHPKLQLKMARAWLAMSGTRPLSVLMHALAEDDDGGAIPTPFLALDAILRHRTRLEYAMLHLADEYEGKYRGRRFKDLMPVLRQLDLRCASNSDPLHTILAQYTAPKLQTAFLRLDHLHSGNFAAPILTHCPRLPWAQLTTLFLASFPFKLVFRILDQTTALEHCRLRVTEDPRSPPPHTISLPRLKSLIVDDCPRIETLLDMLRAPVLKRFCYRRYCAGRERLVAALREVGCTLEWVHLRPAQYPRDEMTEEMWALRGAFSDVPNIVFARDGKAPLGKEVWGSDDWDLLEANRSRTTDTFADDEETVVFPAYDSDSDSARE
ncbi:F-box domain-containing protein [Mycena kentingensis (nom. inval.)]|nr:F-box domain-containing protein [Mycena kentingensis (nom. inval.)]